MLLADQLRQLHEQGRTHGALSPSTIAIAGNGLQMLPPPAGASGVTPYTAPELLQGGPADARSDVFSFGTIVYEMFTGRRAFDGETPRALAAALASAAPRPSGNPAVDRLMGGCLAKSPDSRFQRVQKLMLELRLLTASARRSAAAGVAMPAPAPAPLAYQAVEAPAPQPRYEPVAMPEPAVNHQMMDLESRIAARLQEQEKSVASVAQVAAELLQAMRNQQSAAAQPPRTHTRSFSSGSFDSSSAGGRVEQALDMLGDKLARMDMVLGSLVEKVQTLERNLDSFDTDAAALRDSVTRDIRNFERALKSQSSAIESARTAMGQTDDLVERVVEALDSLQSMFVSAPDERMAS